METNPNINLDIGSTYFGVMLLSEWEIFLLWFFCGACTTNIMFKVPLILLYCLIFVYISFLSDEMIISLLPVICFKFFDLVICSIFPFFRLSQTGYIYFASRHQSRIGQIMFQYFFFSILSFKFTNQFSKFSFLSYFYDRDERLLRTFKNSRFRGAYFR